jgi:PAS domain S-box-containing protein
MTDRKLNLELSVPPSKILLVDDIEENLVALSALLRRPDAQVLLARSGVEALELVLQHEFALAFVDVQMPEMDGFELAELMRGSERSKNIPIIFVTAGTGDATRVFRGYESGAVDFLFKPIDPHILAQKADTFIRLDQQKNLLAAQYRRIEQSEALLRTIMDATQALVYVKDINDQYLTVNKHYRDLLQHVPHDPSSRSVLPQKIADALRSGESQAIELGEAIQVEEVLELQNDIRTFLANKVPLRNSQGEVWGVCAVAADITDIKRMEADLERAVQAREDVLAVVSHDMRNFLQSVKSGVSLLANQRGTLKEEMRDMIYDRLKITVDMMSRMITDLMDMANIRVGRIAVSMRPELVSKLIQQAVLVHEPLAQDKGIRLVTKISNPDDVVQCDRERVLQVLANILGNAIKFTPAGQIEIEVARDGKHIQVSVQDSGPGIADEDLPHVFDAYWSGARDRSRGTGLGLYITKRIIEAHGTRIWIESRLGAGTRVHFWLDRLKESEPKAAA